MASQRDNNNIQTAQVIYEVMENTTPEQRAQGIQMAKSGQQTVKDVQKREGGMSAVGGAAIVGGTVGAIVSGPIVAVGAAGAAAYVAATRNDGVGDAARKMGATTVSTLNSANKYNQEHQVTKRMYDSAKQGVQAASDMNSKYKIMETLSSAADIAAKKTSQFAEDHKIKERLTAASYAAYSAGKITYEQAKEQDAKFHYSEKASSTAKAGWDGFSHTVNEAKGGGQAESKPTHIPKSQDL